MTAPRKVIWAKPARGIASPSTSNDTPAAWATAAAAVTAAVESGARFVLATGRPPRWIHPVVDALGFAPMAVCANGAVIYDPSTDRIVSARTLSADQLGELAEIATRIIPGAGLAVERVGRSAHDAATPQFVSSPGYEHAWLNPDNTEVSVEDLLKKLEVSTLRGLGGAGFPTFRKWSAVRGCPGNVKFVVCNADESEPGTFKDRELLRRTPWLTLEGMILAARHLVVSLLQFVVVIIIVIGEPVCRRHQAQNMCEIVESCR